MIELKLNIKLKAIHIVMLSGAAIELLERLV
jgi:hypothetical protein